MVKSKTHFEQVPVEMVKKIAKALREKALSGNDAIGNDSVAAQEDWRQLAQRVQQEPDPSRMIGLVEQLIVTFDKEKAQKALPPTRNT
jgi:hypothetical protein